MLSVEDLSAAYGESVVVSRVALRVEPGQVVCLLGRNGVGKTTFLKTVMGIQRPRGGRMRYGDLDLTGRPAHERARAGIGYVPQGRGIFPFLTVAENLCLGQEAARHRRDAPTGTLEEMYALFPGLGQMARWLAGTLSGGQQQQLAIARALIGRPSLLLLDEPTEGIQPSIVEEIEALLQALRAQRTVSILL